MQYQATQRIQIRSVADEANDLAYHEDQGDGTPRCGQVNKDWQGRPMHYARVEAGNVTCARCAEIVNEEQRASTDAEAARKREADEATAQAERVRKLRESGRRLALPELDAILKRTPDRRE
jgi:hypothetical protein